MPGVSTNTSLTHRPGCLTARIRLRVVWGLSETMATLVPMIRLRSVDLPALGRPMSETEPARGNYRRSTGASCARRKRTLWMRRRSASRTSTCRPVEIEISPTAGTRPMRVST